MSRQSKQAGSLLVAHPARTHWLQPAGWAGWPVRFTRYPGCPGTARSTGVAMPGG